MLIICILICAASLAMAQQPKTITTKNVAIKDSGLVNLNNMKVELNQLLAQYNKQLKEADKTADRIEELRKRFNAEMKDLESKDRLGNFEIQDLMSTFNQAETLSSNVAKKLSDSRKAVINKL